MSELPIKKTDSVFDELQSMQDRIMKRAYEIFDLNGNFGSDLDNWLQAERELIRKPAIELSEKDNYFNVEVEMPGVNPKDIVIEVTPDELLVKAEMRDEKKEQRDKVYTRELKTGSLFRAVVFPKKIDPDKVKAEFKNGLLKISASVAPEKEAKKVNIHAA